MHLMLLLLRRHGHSSQILSEGVVVLLLLLLLQLVMVLGLTQVAALGWHRAVATVVLVHSDPSTSMLLLLPAITSSCSCSHSVDVVAVTHAHSSTHGTGLESGVLEGTTSAELVRLLRRCHGSVNTEIVLQVSGGVASLLLMLVLQLLELLLLLLLLHLLMLLELSHLLPLLQHALVRAASSVHIS